MQIEIENKSYLIDSTKITGRSLKKYLELSIMLKNRINGLNIDENELLTAKAEFITSFMIDNISSNYIVNYVQIEDIELYSNLLFNHLLNTKKIDTKIIKLFPKKNTEQPIKQKSVFSDDETSKNENMQEIQKIIDIINSLYSFAINNCRCSYYELENKIDWFYFLDFIDYELNRKEKHQNDTDEDIFDKEFI